jgi:hypothetical protein
MKPTLKAPGSKLLKLEHEKLLSNFDFNFNLRRCNQVLLFATPEQHTELAGFFAAVAQEYRGQYMFVTVGMDGGESTSGVAEYFGLVAAAPNAEDEEEDPMVGHCTFTPGSLPPGSLRMVLALETEI